jgi:hypothetical protein
MPFMAEYKEISLPDARGSQFLPFISAVFISLAVAWPCFAFTTIAVPVKARPVKTASWIKTDKAPDRVPQRPVTIEIITASTVAMHERATLPWSCETIRQATAKLTPEQIARLARIYRLTDQQKAEARNCLKRTSARDPRCDGPARYEAMREAFEAGRPQPC